MKIFNDISEIKNIEPCVVALGNFDGVHLGHQVIIKKAVNDAKYENLKSGVFTFSNHPRNLTKKENVVKNILYMEEKMSLIESLGVDYVFNIAFDEEIMNMSPVDFIENLLLKNMNAREVMCGFNYRFGYRAEGDINLLIREGMKKEFGVHVAEPFKIDGRVVSSSLIREEISKGNMQECEKLLGRKYTVKGEVVIGNKIGRTIGFPTCNINIDKDMVSPANGVYITRCQYDGVYYPSITNVGQKPTIGEYERNIETHIFKFDKQLYGNHIKVEFIDKLREEMKFNSLEELKEQIDRDYKKAYEYHRQEGYI